MFSPLSSEIQKQRRWKLPAIIAAIAIVVIFVLGEPVWAVYHHASSGKRFVETAGVILPPLILLALSLWLGLFSPTILHDAWSAAVAQLFPEIP